MPGNFEWQTEDEEQWHDPAANESFVTRSRRRRRWRFLIFIILIMSVAGTTIYWRARSAVRQAEESRSEDVLSSYYLIDDAIHTKDSELFVTLLSGADLVWAETYQELFKRGWIYDKRFIGLGTSPSKREPPTVELSPELTSAVVSSALNYELVNRDGITRSIQLRQDSVYRLGRRWLLAPPEEAFWDGSESATLDGVIKSVTYPGRDRTIVEGMIDYLDDGLKQLCQSSEFIDCPEGLEVEIEFSTDPESLSKIIQSYLESGFTQMGLRRPGSRINLTLPTPTLVGVPVDEASFQVLRRGYGAYVAGAVINRYFDWSCCDSVQIAQATIQAFLVDLGMHPWPLEVPVMNRTDKVADSSYDLALMCQQAVSNQGYLYKLESDSGEWKIISGNRHFTQMQSLPGGSGIALLEKIPQANDIILLRMVIFQDGEEYVLSEQYLAGAEGRAARFEVRDRGQLLLLEIPRVKEGFTDFHVLSLADCVSFDCEMKTYSLFGRPYWSPDGDQWLVREFGQLWRRQGYMSSLVSDGFAPFWINTDVFGYVRQLGDDQFIVTINTSTDEPELIFPISTFSDQMPDLDQSKQLRVGFIVADPAQPFEHWFILFFLADRLGRFEDAVMMDFDLTTGDAKIVHQSDQLNKLALSDAGELLALSFYDPMTQHWQVQVHETGITEELVYILTSGSSSDWAPSLAWSPDNQLLAVMNKGVLTIISRDGLNQFDFIPPVAGCFDAAWIKPG